MEKRLSNQRSLDPLPESGDDYWEGAEVHTGITPHDILADHGHYFVRVRGHEAYCKGCGWGFALDPGDKIKDGHLLNRKGELII